MADVVNALRREGLLRDATHAESLPSNVPSITDDSRRVEPGALFVAVRGSTRDGHDFLADAAARGATAAIVEDAAAAPPPLPTLVVRDARRAAAVAAAVVYGHPVAALAIVGVTGTSGKTTTVAMLRHLLDEPGAAGRSASVGTLGVLIGGEGEALPGGAGLTTPGPVELQRVLRALVDAGVRRVAMEVSSHALDQHRVEGMRFVAAVFTNLSRDHLDYHGSMESYRAAKARLLGYLAPDGVAIVNADEAAWSALPRASRTVTFSLASHDADVTARAISHGTTGSEWTLGAGGDEAHVRLPVIGEFNITNALGAAAAAWAMGLGIARIAERLSSLPQVPGRLERILDVPAVIRDYAHKPDALERALDAVRPFAPGRLILLFGCGGDRDRGKRPIMGEIAARKADLVVLTSDNPRTEDPERILDEIEEGMPAGGHVRIEDRHEAIEHALAIARAGDLVFLAGKGHETYQVRGSETLPFDEKSIVRAWAERRGVA